MKKENHVYAHVSLERDHYLCVNHADLPITNAPDSIPHIFTPRRIRKYPRSPHPVPHEFLTFQKGMLVVGSTPYPTMTTAWFIDSDDVGHPVGCQIPLLYE